MKNCPACGKPPPAEWCWEGSITCPCAVPPRGLDRRTWHYLRDLYQRIEALETRDVETPGPGNRYGRAIRSDPGTLTQRAQPGATTATDNDDPVRGP